jgi:hypothetical protein
MKPGVFVLIGDIFAVDGGVSRVPRCVSCEV